jgi:hypothetical protein
MLNKTGLPFLATTIPAKYFLVASCQVVIAPEVRRSGKVRVHFFAELLDTQPVNVG